MVGPTCWRRVGYDDKGYYFFWRSKFGRECGCLCGFLLNCKTAIHTEGKDQTNSAWFFSLGAQVQERGGHKTPKPQILNFLIKCVAVFHNKDARHKNDTEWADLRADISHMRLIQGKQLKLVKVLSYGWFSHHFHVIFIFFWIWYVVYAQYRNDVSIFASMLHYRTDPNRSCEGS